MGSIGTCAQSRHRLCSGLLVQLVPAISDKHVCSRYLVVVVMEDAEMLDVLVDDLESLPDVGTLPPYVGATTLASGGQKNRDRKIHKCTYKII